MLSTLAEFMPAGEKIWVVADRPPSDEIASLAADFGLSPLVIQLAMQRGFTNRDAMESFFYPRLQDLSDPFLMPGMANAVTRIFQAIDEGESVMLYGDYDVDGVSSLAFLVEVLSAYGLSPNTFLPTRLGEGYGLSLDGIEKFLVDHSPTLLIAADCGTNSREEAVFLKEKGIDLLILDHHEPSADGTAECVSIVNPKMGDEYHYLCTGGVVFKVAHALLKTRPIAGFDLRDYLDIVSLATVADIVPLVDENRIFVRRGLSQLDRNRCPGIQALKKVASTGTPMRAHDIGFKLGPRLNAAGRLDTAEASLNLLLTRDFGEATRIANDLDSRNRERQTLEQRTREEAEQMLESLGESSRSHCIVVGARGWHPGVVGIVASRLMRAFHRPTFVIGVDEETGIGKGSGRSIEGVSLVEAIRVCGDLLESGGGHEMAAGISIREENIDAFREAFSAHLVSFVSDEQLLPRLKVDAEASFDELTLDLLDSYELLGPFGSNNPQPVLMSRGIQLMAEPRIIKDKHVKFKLAQDGVVRDAIFFGGASVELPRAPWDIAYTIDRNEFRGFISVTISIQAIRAAR